MRYELMLPHQIRQAIAGNWPVILPLGVLEYHGEHLAVGMDTLAVTRVLEHLEREADKSSCRPSTMAQRATRSLGPRAMARSMCRPIG